MKYISVAWASFYTIWGTSISKSSVVGWFWTQWVIKMLYFNLQKHPRARTFIPTYALKVSQSSLKISYYVSLMHVSSYSLKPMRSYCARYSGTISNKLIKAHVKGAQPEGLRHHAAVPNMMPNQPCVKFELVLAEPCDDLTFSHPTFSRIYDVRALQSQNKNLR